MESPEITIVATRYVEPDGARMIDVHPLEQLPEVAEKIHRDGARLVSVSRFALILALSLFASRAGAQSAPPQKDPAVGVILSFFMPGMGQVYADETLKGMAMTVVAVGAPLAGYAASGRYHCRTACPQENWTPFYVGIGVGVATWIVSMIDAPQAAHRFNAKHAPRVQPAVTRNGIGAAVSF